MTYKLPSLEGECILYVILPACPCLDQYPLLTYYTVANGSYIIKLLYNSTVSMVTDAILFIAIRFICYNN